jgi:CBS domain-containing protein
MTIKVEDIMAANVITIEERGTVREAAELMKKHDIGCLIVAKSGKPTGIVTERDMLKRVILEVVDPVFTKVHEIMSKPLVSGRPGMTIDEASNLMREKKIKKLPIVKNGQVVGLVTTTDFVRSPQMIKMMIRRIKRQIYNDVMESIKAKLEQD